MSPTLSRNVGPGIDPLNVCACAVTPLPMSTVASSATSVVSTTFGSGFVSVTNGMVYGLSPEVASARLPGSIANRTALRTIAVASRTKPDRRGCWRIRLVISPVPASPLGLVERSYHPRRRIPSARCNNSAVRFVAVVVLALTAAPPAAASIVVTTDAARPALRVDAQGNTGVSWTTGGRRETLLVPVRGAAVAGRKLAGRDVSRAVARPVVPFERVVRLGRGGWYYALQAWQPTPGGPVELRFSRWRGAPTTVQLTAEKSTASDTLTGRVSFGGKPVPAVHAFVFVDSLIGGAWKRVGGVAPRADGTFEELVPYTLVGESFRATVAGPNAGSTYAPDSTAMVAAP